MASAGQRWALAWVARLAVELPEAAEGRRQEVFWMLALPALELGLAEPVLVPVLVPVRQLVGQRPHWVKLAGSYRVERLL